MLNKTKSAWLRTTKLMAFLCLLLTFSTHLIAQTSRPNQEPEEIFKVVEEMPEFPGGMEVCMKFLGDNMKYPESAKAANKEGTTFVGMVINKQGEVTDVKVLRGFDKACEEEAVRVVKMMPNWKPGKQRGKLVKVAYTIPVNFRLSKKVHLPEPVIIDDIESSYHDVPVEPAPKESVEMWNVVQEMPEFPGGQNKMFKFLADNIQYPKSAKAAGKEGTVFVGYVIRKTGKIDQIVVKRSSETKDLDEEAMRVVKLMPDWTPGKERGKPVDVEFTLPIKFKLQDDEKKASTLPTNIEDAIMKEEVVEEPEPLPASSTISDQEIFMVVEEMPEYPGGTKALMEYLGANLKYPEQAKADKVEGLVVVQFIVEKDGSLSGFDVKRGVSELLDVEALRVAKSMSNWKPGKQRGKHVRVKFSLPVRFKLDS